MKYSFCAIPAIVVLVVFLGCHQKSDNETYLENHPQFGTFNHGTILIKTRFSECGEYGGHREEIAVDLYKDITIRAKYYVYPFNCDSLKHTLVDNNLIPTAIKQLELNNQQLTSIIKYIQRLIVSKTEEKYVGHAGNIFSVENDDSTLVISMYSRDPKNVDSYKQLIGEIFIEK